MSRIIELPEPVYEALEAAATNRGLTPAAWIADQLVSTGHVETATHQPAAAKSLGDLLAGKIGRIASGGGERLSEQEAELFTDELERKRQAGRL